MRIKISEIKFDKNQPRRTIDQKSVENLAKSMKVEGLIHPVEVDESHTIIVGEIRYRAAKLLGWDEIEANVYKGELKPYERLRRQMAENLQQSGSKGGGQPMNAIDTARAWVRLFKLKTGKDWEAASESREETYGIMKEISEEIGVTDKTLREYLELLEEPGYVIDDILKGRPRTLYGEAGRLPEKIGKVEIREPVKQAISKGEITSRLDLRRLVGVLKVRPSKAEIEMARITHKQGTEANRFMDKALELQIAIKNSHPEKWSSSDRHEALKHFRGLPRIIADFMAKL